MMRRPILFTLTALLLALAATVTLLLALNESQTPVAHAQGPDGYDTYYVAPGGDCGGMTPCYASVQAAVDAADDPDDMVKVATGTYTDVSARQGVTQAVYISKTVTVRGGYTTTNWATSDPETNPTTLDAQGQGRVIYITGEISPTIEGLSITGGDAAGLGGYEEWGTTYDYGGGVYIITATAAIRDNKVFSNTSPRYGAGFGLVKTAALISGNTIISNTADWSGGLELQESAATLSGNTVTDNVGTGVSLNDSDATLSGNTVTANSGTGVYLYDSNGLLRENIVSDNAGNGIEISNKSAPTLEKNTITGNRTGIYIGNASGTGILPQTPILRGNTIMYNVGSNEGGGIYMNLSNAVLINNLIADNSANLRGSGLYIEGSTPQLINNTIARNTGGGGGIYVTDSPSLHFSRAVLTNTILVSHVVGIHATAGNTVTLESTLWGSGAWANVTEWSGSGNIVTGTINIRDIPDFVDPISGDYHIAGTSAACDAGIDVGVNEDIDDQVRPMDWAYDIGADEYAGVGLGVVIQPSEVFLNLDHVLTYTIALTSAGTEDATGVVLTDTLSTWQRASSVASSAGTCTIADAGWGGAVVCSPGSIVTGTTVLITLTAETSGSTPLGQAIDNTVVVTANETTNTAQVTTYAQDCHVRLNDTATEYFTVQAAVDTANPGDLVKIAGVCMGAVERESGRQQVYLSKNLTLRGGYTTTNWTTPDPESNPTTLNALGHGRVFYIIGDISPTVEGLRITGGDATGLPGYKWSDDQVGGGMFVINATPTINNNHLIDNIAHSGGGMYLYESDATISSNLISANSADEGGGLLLRVSAASLDSNTIISNTAGVGGGLWVMYGAPSLHGNAIVSNTADLGGGGLILIYSDVAFSENTVANNVAGLSGGGLDQYAGSTTFSGNVFTDNSADRGGGCFLNSSNAVLTNTVIADNQAGTAGSGLYVTDSSSQLLHTTIARNSGGDGSGVYLGSDSSIALTNTILVSHTVGLSATGNSAVVVNGVLWFATPITISQATTATVTMQNQYQGDPAFASDGYHLTVNSAAIDKGVVTGLDADIDGESRPMGQGYDLGADELPPNSNLTVTKQAVPELVQAGEQLTYTITITNTGNVDLHAIVTDTLPNQVTPTGELVWSPTITAPGGVWMRQVIVTVTEGYSGTLTNVVQASTLEGASGMYTTTSQAQSPEPEPPKYPVYLPLVLRND
jgi:uncharacterized repeat protein (TIGR01451 family)